MASVVNTTHEPADTEDTPSSRWRSLARRARRIIATMCMGLALHHLPHAPTMPTGPEQPSCIAVVCIVDNNNEK